MHLLNFVTNTKKKKTRIIEKLYKLPHYTHLNLKHKPT